MDSKKFYRTMIHIYGETPLETVKKTITINEAVDWIQRNKNAALAEDFKSTFKKFDSILKSQN